MRSQKTPTSEATTTIIAIATTKAGFVSHKENGERIPNGECICNGVRTEVENSFRFSQ